MNEPINPPSAVQAFGNTFSFWQRFRTTFGPAVVGLLGGALTAGIAATSLLPILRNAAETYSKYPSLQAPSLVGDFRLPSVLSIPLVCLGVAAPFAMGFATARLVKPKDWWEAVSAGLSTAATASATAYLLWIGWMVTMAMVIVPSISDLTLISNSTRTPTEATASPSDVLTDHYPDLKATPADERGHLFFPKIVSDQVVGSAYSVWYGVLVSMAAVGVPGFCGTLVATWLRGREGSQCSRLLSYFELTVATSVPLGLLLYSAVQVGFPIDQQTAWFRTAVMVVSSAVVISGVVNRWNWSIRLVAAVSWALVLFGVGVGESYSWPLTYAAYGIYVGLVLLLLRQYRNVLGQQTALKPGTALAGTL